MLVNNTQRFIKQVCFAFVFLLGCNMYISAQGKAVSEIYFSATLPTASYNRAFSAHSMQHSFVGKSAHTPSTIYMPATRGTNYSARPLHSVTTRSRILLHTSQNGQAQTSQALHTFTHLATQVQACSEAVYDTHASRPIMRAPGGGTTPPPGSGITGDASDKPALPTPITDGIGLLIFMSGVYLAYIYKRIKQVI